MKKVIKEHIYKIGDTLIDDKRDITIIDIGYKEKMLKGKPYKLKAYKYKCNKCGFDCGEYYNSRAEKFENDFWVLEDAIKSGNGCFCCSTNSYIVVKGINDIMTVKPELTKYILNKDDIYKHKPSTKKEIWLRCPDCGKEKLSNLKNVYIRGFHCSYCSDGISFPEKVMMYILDSLDINYVVQLSRGTFKWCDRYKYDFYLPEYDCIIETHGIQHYEETRRKGVRTLAEEQENDKVKRELALANGIKHYIELDCRESDVEYIKNNIEKDLHLSKIINTKNIDWGKCIVFASKSIMMEVINDYNEGLSVNELCLKYKGKLSRRPIYNYLVRGNILGLCKYYGGKIPLNVYNEKCELIHEFASISELINESDNILGVKMAEKGIKTAIKNKTLYKGYFVIKKEESDDL